MARRPSKSQRRRFAELIARLSPEMQEAFLSAAEDMRNGVAWDQLLAALERRDVDGAIAALQIDAASFARFEQVRTTAFLEGGIAASTYLTGPGGSRIYTRFDMANPAAERWIEDNIRQGVQDFVDEQIAASRSAILRGYRAGQHPNTIATDLAGRVGPTGRRTGGTLGLTGPQTDHVASMRRRLASGDPAEMRKVFTMQRRDRRYDALIRRHIEAGTALSEDEVAQLTGRYSDRLLAKRAEDVARTSTGTAVMSGRHEEWRQVLDDLGLPDEALIKTWTHGGGVKTPRHDHQAMSGQSVRGLETPFVFEGGSLRFALDPEGPVGEVANCSCDTEFRVDFHYDAEAG